MTKLSKNLITKGLAASLLVLSSFSFADSLLITNAKVHTATDKGVLSNATVLVEDGVITAINPANPQADTTIDAKGQSLTPGIIAPMNQLGLIEVNAVSRTRDAGDKKADITFDPSLAFNPKSTLIPYSRKGGITRSVISPSGGDTIFAGQISVVDLSGEYHSVVDARNAVYVQLGSKTEGSRAMSLQTLYNKLEDAEKALEKAAKAKAKKEAKKDGDKKDKKDDKEPSREEKVVNSILDGKPLVLAADRDTDLLHLIDLKERFKLKLVINGAGDAISVAEQLAKAEIPVIINPLSALPNNFDSLHASLENAGKLAKAGVKVILAETDTHNIYQIRFSAGNAVSYGMSADDALASLTVNVAEAFNINAGTIEVGKPADLVLWKGDMFDLSGYVDKMWINGKAYSTDSRHDKLRDRYMKKTDMPRAYVE
jgi:imidazolonepropionase-like amidohydrolase